MKAAKLTFWLASPRQNSAAETISNNALRNLSQKCSRTFSTTYTALPYLAHLAAINRMAESAVATPIVCRCDNLSFKTSRARTTVLAG